MIELRKRLTRIIQYQNKTVFSRDLKVNERVQSRGGEKRGEIRLDAAQDPNNCRTERMRRRNEITTKERHKVQRQRRRLRKKVRAKGREGGGQHKVKLTDGNNNKTLQR